jgi:hypothetical protein
METLVRDHPTATTGQTVTVGANDSGRMVSLRVGDRLAIDAPSIPGTTWRLRGGAPVLTPTTPSLGDPSFVLRASRPGRTGLDLVASGEAQALPRPLRLIVLVSA